MQLNEIKDKLNKNQYLYFLQLQQEIDLPLYFIGSIARSDFVKGKSDLDIEVFSENIKSSKLKIEAILKYYNKKNENRILTFKINDIPFSGYKYSHKISKDDKYFDLTLYKKSCKTNDFFQF